MTLVIRTFGPHVDAPNEDLFHELSWPRERDEFLGSLDRMIGQHRDRLADFVGELSVIVPPNRMLDRHFLIGEAINRAFGSLRRRSVKIEEGPFVLDLVTGGEDCWDTREMRALLNWNVDLSELSNQVDKVCTQKERKYGLKSLLETHPKLAVVVLGDIERQHQAVTEAVRYRLGRTPVLFKRRSDPQSLPRLAYGID